MFWCYVCLLRYCTFSILLIMFYAGWGRACVRCRAARSEPASEHPGGGGWLVGDRQWSDSPLFPHPRLLHHWVPQLHPSHTWHHPAGRQHGHQGLRQVTKLWKHPSSAATLQILIKVSYGKVKFIWQILLCQSDLRLQPLSTFNRFNIQYLKISCNSQLKKLHPQTYFTV